MWDHHSRLSSIQGHGIITHATVQRGGASPEGRMALAAPAPEESIEREPWKCSLLCLYLLSFESNNNTSAQNHSLQTQEL